MATYYSSYTGAQLDEAIRKVFNEWPSNTNTTYTQLPVVTTTLADGIRYDSTGGGYHLFNTLGKPRYIPERM